MQWASFASTIRHHSAQNQERIEHAFALGRRLHEGQTRKSGEPYFSHPIAVAQILIQMGADADTIIAALLHDTVEDTSVTLREIEEQFGTTVATLIDGVTKLKEGELPKSASVNEQIETIRKMFTLMERDIRIMVIKLADRLHNMQTLAFCSPEKQIVTAKETQEVYVKIADRLSMQELRYALAELCISVLDPDTYPSLKELRENNLARSTVIISQLNKRILGSGLPFPADAQMTTEKKTWEQLSAQLAMGTHATTLSPINIVFACNNVNECYQIMGTLHQLWQRQSMSFEDFINSPAMNGYRGLHTTIILNDGSRVRCRIRTKDMQRYALKGITLFCFDDKAQGVSTYLPWTKRISPLAQTTKDRSQEFWNNLQSDILGKSIVIHGQGDQTIVLPQGATALDGVMYLFGDRGLHVSQIQMNGQPVGFGERLTPACALTASFSPESQVQLSWLRSVRTGIATAVIRQGLSQETREKKVEIGQWILQERLSKQGRGFLSEFDQWAIENALKQQGHGSLADVYVELAEGRITPEEVEDALFERANVRKRKSERSRPYTLSCRVPDTHRRFFLEILQYYSVSHMQIKEKGPHMLSYSVRLHLTPEERETLEFTLHEDLHAPFVLHRHQNIFYMSLGIPILCLLWGIDPVAAHLLLQDVHVDPIDLTIIRFLSLAVMSTVLLIIARVRNPLPEARLTLRNPTLWLTVGLQLCIALTTYYSLQGTQPSHYTIPMTAAGITLTSIVNRRRWNVLIVTWALVLAGTLLLMFRTPDWNAQPMLFTLLAVTSFSIFSIVSERYKRQEKVAARSAQYFFLLCILSTVLTIPLIPLATVADVPLHTLLSMILFSIVFTGLPYYIYYHLLSHREIDFILRYSFLIIPATLLSQLLFVGHIGLVAIFSGILVTAGAILPLIP